MCSEENRKWRPEKHLLSNTVSRVSLRIDVLSSYHLSEEGLGGEKWWTLDLNSCPLLSMPIVVLETHANCGGPVCNKLLAWKRNSCHYLPGPKRSGCDLWQLCRLCVLWDTRISESPVWLWDFLAHLHFKMSLLPPCRWSFMFIFNLHVIKMNQSSFHQLQMGLIGMLGFMFLCLL